MAISLLFTISIIQFNIIKKPLFHMKETRISSNCVSLNQFEIDSRGTYNSELKLQTVQSISKKSKISNRNKRHIILFYVILRRATNFIYEDKRDKNV